MGILGLFQKRGATPDNIAKQVTKAKDPYSQSEYRVDAMKRLLQWNTKESLLGVLDRFSAVVQSPHWDEEEKTWLKEELQQKGNLAKEAIVQFIATAAAVTHPAQILASLCSNQQEFATLLQQALQARPPEDHRGSQAKRELILALQAIDTEGIVATICPYLHDQNDDVRCAAIDAVRARGNKKIRLQLVDMLTDTGNSPRVLRHAAAAASRLNLPVGDAFVLPPSLQGSYIVQDSKLKHRSAQPTSD
ncbi:MAG: HEAT repeat domain-containing protein [Myxococcota bacterium]